MLLVFLDSLAYKLQLVFYRLLSTYQYLFHHIGSLSTIAMLFVIVVERTLGIWVVSLFFQSLCKYAICFICLIVLQ